MVSIKRVIDKNPGKRKSFSEILSNKDKILVSDDLIETDVITNGTYSEKDKKRLDELYDEYRREIGLTPSKYLRDSFWHGVEKGNYLMLIAREHKTGKPLGFIRIVREKTGYGNYFHLQDNYTIPEARKLRINEKLAKKAYSLARMDNIEKIRSSVPISKAGMFAMGKMDRMQEEWAKIPQERFQKREDYLKELRERHRKRFK